MSKYKTDIKDLINTLTAKGAIIDNKPIAHKELIENKPQLNTLTSIESEYLIVLRDKEEIKEAYLESKDWDKVINYTVDTIDKTTQEAFIDYVEEVYKVKIKDAKHLQKITGCKEYKDTEKVKLQDVVNTANYNKYSRDLEIALEKGAKYKDLLDIKLEDYQLPETWSSSLGRDKDSSILWAISFHFMINEPVGIMLLPSLRSIADEVEAPYSVIMDAHKLTK